MLLDREGPTAFRGRETTARVLIAAGPYRLSGEWWRETGRGRRACSARVLGRARVRRRRLPRAPGSARRPLVPRWVLRLTLRAEALPSPTTSSCAAGRRSAFSTARRCPRIWSRRRRDGGHDALALADRDGVYGAPRFFAAARKTGAAADRRRRGHAGGRGRAAAPAGRGSARLPEPLPADHRRQRRGKHKSDPRDAPRDLLAAHAGGLIALGGRGAARRSAGARRRVRARAASTSRCSATSTPPRRTATATCWRRRRRWASAWSRPTTSATPRPRSGIVHDVLTCAREKATVDEIGRRLPPNGERWLKSPAEMAALFRDLPAAVRATRAIAERCAFTLADLGYAFPDYDVPAGETRAELPREALLGRASAAATTPAIRSCPRCAAQLARELGIIGRLGLAGYFLIVWDIVQFAQSRGHHGAGARLGGELGRLLRPRHHRRRSGADGAAVRALPVRGARRERRQRRRSHARHRSRSAVGRRARAGDPARLRASTARAAPP